jgi:hypothetical protein
MQIRPIVVIVRPGEEKYDPSGALPQICAVNGSAG